MVREIMKNEDFLRIPSSEAEHADISIADDLMETLRANAERCVGMAANMIGMSRRIIVFNDSGVYCEMFNPVIVKKTDPYEAEEGCLSLVGTRKTKRYKTVKVQWQTRAFKIRVKNFTGFTAQIIQHEIDHLNGILI